jgi:hypothetical protein
MRIEIKPRSGGSPCLSRPRRLSDRGPVLHRLTPVAIEMPPLRGFGACAIDISQFILDMQL